ncbi:response regulator [Erysipelothrix urinaevulpis]|uniref:response regulator transcription factor n=1 Tax=Erysipelothrix urinaevulpis TaxID=2683717 RepID=UPI001358E887|nr:response regulator [Erysipelothrix urinaevulpis]
MKILIADDERLITEWLEFCFVDLEGIEIVGIAKNGQEALELFNAHHPDVVLSDIKMPVMNGLELLTQIKSIEPNTYVVMLTAYSEFEFAREAIRNHADDYFLKTEMNKEKIQEYFKNLELKDYSDVQQGPNNHPIIKQILLKKEALSEDDILSLKEQMVNTKMNNFVALSFWNKDIVENRIYLTELFKEKYQILHQFESNKYVYTIIISLTNYISEMDRLQEINSLEQIIKSTDCLVSGVSALHDTIKTVNLSIYESIHSLMLTFYDQRKVIQLFNRKNSIVEIQRQENAKDFELTQFYQKIITSRISERSNSIDELLEFVEVNQNSNVILFKKICLDIASILYGNLANQNIDYSLQELNHVKQTIHEGKNFMIVKDALLAYNESFSIGETVDRSRLSMPIARALKFIEQHYHEPISLDIVADAVNLNPEYLSRSFKKEMNKTYSAFLSELRLEKARVLLLDTTYQVQEVANAVGYYNVSYFSTLFKKEFGINPYEYRKQNHR